MSQTPGEPAPHAWLPPAQVVAWLQLDDPNDVRVEASRAAAAAYVERVRPDVFGTDPPGSPGSDILLAGLIATRRLYDRATGDGFSEFGQAVALLQVDPDVSALLGLGPHAAPRVG